MEIKFDSQQTKIDVTQIGESKPFPGHAGYFSHKGCLTSTNDEVSIVSKGAFTTYGTSDFVKGVIDGKHTLYATMPAFHGLKQSPSTTPDDRYTGGAQPPSTPAPPAAEKPKEAPSAIPPGVTPVTVEPSGAYKNQPMILTATPCAPKLDASGGFVRDNITKQAKWEVRVQGDAIPKGIICKVFGEADKNKPPLQPGKQLLYVSREDNKGKPGQYWYEVSAKPSEGKGGGGGFRADVELTIVAAIGSNPTIERKDWLEAAKELREAYFKLKGTAK